MQNAKGSWTKIALITALVCCGAGLMYGWKMVEQENQARYKQAMEFSFEKKYPGIFHPERYQQYGHRQLEWWEGGYHRPDVKGMKSLPQVYPIHSGANDGGTR